MPSLATRFAFERSAGGAASLANQIAEINTAMTAQADTLDALIAEEDILSGTGGLAQLLVQNNAIIRLLAAIYLTMHEGDQPPVLDDDDIETLIEELTP